MIANGVTDRQPHECNTLSFDLGSFTRRLGDGGQGIQANPKGMRLGWYALQAYGINALRQKIISAVCEPCRLAYLFRFDNRFLQQILSLRIFCNRHPVGPCIIDPCEGNGRGGVVDGLQVHGTRRRQEVFAAATADRLF